MKKEEADGRLLRRERESVKDSAGDHAEKKSRMKKVTEVHMQRKQCGGHPTGANAAIR